MCIRDRLRVLRVPGSGLSAAVARALTSGARSRFPDLRALDLASCRGLPRDVRRVSLATFPRENVRDIARALDADATDAFDRPPTKRARARGRDT